jgi:integrase
MAVKVKRYKGSWYVFIDRCGQRKAKKVGSREAAEKVRREIEIRLALGEFGLTKEDTPKVPTLAEYAESWLKHHADRHLKPSTADFYREFLNLYVLPRHGQIPIDQIRRESVKQWIAELADRGLARNTIRLAVSTLRAVLNAAIEDSLLGFNPAQKLGRLVKAEEPSHQPSALSPEEVDRFLNSVADNRPRHYALFLTALRAGLRAGELLALRWGDIQFGESDRDSNRYILVQRNYDRRSRKFLTPKSKKPRRVDLSRELRNVLLELQDQRMLLAFGRGQDSVADDLVFPSEKGTVLNVSNIVRRHFVPALDRAGLRRIRFHDLRHTFGSLLIQAGAPLTYVRDQMGHSSIKITVDIYGHMIPGADIGYMDRLDRKIPQTTPQKSATPAQPGKEVLQGQPTQTIETIGVSDGIRTRDVQIHSLALYQAELRSPYGPCSALPLLCSIRSRRVSTRPVSPR